MTSGRDTILVVDDDKDVRMILSAFLRDEGYATAEAVNGRDALGLLQTGLHPCVILLDLMMPVMSGWEFRAAQVQDPALASIPVVVVSADHTAGARVKALDAAAFLAKPIDCDRLLHLLSEHCPRTCGALA